MWGIVDSMCDVSTDAAGGLDQRPESTKALIIVWIAKGACFAYSVWKRCRVIGEGQALDTVAPLAARKEYRNAIVNAACGCQRRRLTRSLKIPLGT